jgi:hypothetical protein
LSSNPPWADAALSTVWPDLQRLVPDDLLPRDAPGKSASPTFDIEPQTVRVGARGGARGRAEHVALAEFGCGAWGCAYPSGRDDTVVKITLDASEARFAAAAMSIGEWPAGMVQYTGAVKMGDFDLRRIGRELPEGASPIQTIYLLWREAAEDVGRLAVRGCDDLPKDVACDDFAVMHQKLGIFQHVGSALFKMSRKKGFGDKVKRALGVAEDMHEGLKGSPEWQRCVVGPKAKGARTAQWIEVAAMEAGAPADVFAAAIALVVLNVTGQAIQETEVGRHIGGALMFYYEHAIVLGDPHMGNVGRVRRPHARGGSAWAITDPGVAVMLDGRYDGVQIEELRR